MTYRGMLTGEICERPYLIGICPLSSIIIVILEGGPGREDLMEPADLPGSKSGGW